MDLRQQRTQQYIINAFLQLRSQKKLEKITIRELAEKAGIHKATFYLHYHDIYELSETLEWKVIDDIFCGLSDPSLLITDPERFNEELYCLFVAHESLLNILFTDDRSGMLIVKLEERLKKYIFNRHPDWDTLEMNVILTYLIHGAYYAYIQYRNHEPEQVLLVIDKMASAVLHMYTQDKLTADGTTPYTEQKAEQKT